MSVGQVFFLAGFFICTIGGLMYIREWYCDRHTDLRSFSWKRLLTKEEGFSPKEKLVHGLIGILLGLLSGAIAAGISL